MSFKQKYAFQWPLSAQKEAFVKVLLESWGFRAKAVGVGTLSDKYTDESQSLPDFAIYHNNTLIAYVEVTGGNINLKNIISDGLWIGLHKYRKYVEFWRRRPVYFIYLGFRKNRLSIARYCSIETVDKYSNCVKILTIRGKAERYIIIPYDEFKPLHELYQELKYYSQVM